MRTGCTDMFKESLDYLDSMINLLGYNSDVYILDDINADLDWAEVQWPVLLSMNKVKS